MKLVDELFSHFVPKEEALLSYGFSKAKDGFFCQKKVMGEAFDLLLTVRKNALFAKLLDADFGDEYRRIDTEEEVGGFVADLRRECETLLLDLRDRCFEARNFVFDQSNRLAAHIKQVYGVDPEFLWEDSPDCGVFRNRATQKWFGILMYIDRKKILPPEMILPYPETMGAEDFAFFLQQKPGARFCLGTHKEGTEIHPLHNSRFSPDEGCLTVAPEIFLQYILDNQD